MKKILIYGPKDPPGGLESIIKSYTDRLPTENFICDYIVFGDAVSFESEILQKGGKVFYLPNRIKHRKEYKAKLKHIFDENNYVAVWANLSGLTNIDMLKFGKRYGVPIRIVHSHSSAFSWTGWLMKYLVPLFHYKNQIVLGRYATEYWACSEKARSFMFSKRLYPKVVYVHNAVDTAVFCPNSEKREKIRKELKVENNFVVGHIARMCVDKNQLFLLEVFKKLLEIKSNAKLLFVGDGELKEQILAKANALEITENIVFTGFKKDTVKYYMASDVFCLPSVNEGLGLSLIEAQACGVPCVTSDRVPKEADVTGNVKYLDLDDSLEKWAEALIAMSEQKIEYPAEKLKNAGYDIDVEAEKLRGFFEEGKFE